MIKYLSLFSGIGSPEQALKNIGVDYELIGSSEIDKYAVQSYCAVHGADPMLDDLGDITKIDIGSLPVDEIDLVNNKIIPHDDYPDSAAYSVGTTLQNNRWESEITKVSKINKAQINQYPSELNDVQNVP